MKRLFFALAAIALQACVTAPDLASERITDPQMIFAAADWTDDLDRAVRAAGWGDRIPEMQAHLDEKGGWPGKMKDGDARWYQESMIRLYNVREIARLSFYGQPAVLLVVPASANQHMPGDWKPTEDFFIVIGAKAVAKAS